MSEASRHRIVALGALGAVLGALAGCGGTAVLTHGQLISQADSICREANKKLGPPPQARTLAEITKVVTTTYQSGQQQITKLRALKPSQADQSMFQQWLSAYETTVNVFRQELTALQQRNKQQLAAANQSFQADLARSERLAAQIGFTVCGRSGA